MDAKETPRAEAVETAYAQDRVTLEKCGREVTISEISFGDYAALSRFFGEYMKRFLGLSIDSEGNQVAQENIDRRLVKDALVDSISANEEATHNLCVCMTNLTLDEVKALSLGDGGQLISACIERIDAAEVSRFFRHEMEMVQRIQLTG